LVSQMLISCMIVSLPFLIALTLVVFSGYSY
jgi:hypothetical protein